MWIGCGSALMPFQAVNALTEIHLLSDALGSATSDDGLKSYDLVWLEHLVGDVHQPLHATTRYSAAFPSGDRGGNSETLSCAAVPAPCARELHALWDNAMGISNDDVSAAMAYAKTLPHVALTEAGNPDKWVADSFALAKVKVYSGTMNSTPLPHHLSAAYRTRATTVSRSQAAKAGRRLADLINGKWG